MLTWLRKMQVRCFVVGLVLATFLPMASATVACEIACLMAGLTQGALQQDNHSSSERHHPQGPEHDLARLGHGGPCHLAAMPTMCGSIVAAHRADVSATARQLTDLLPASYVGPPPEHKPRT